MELNISELIGKTLTKAENQNNERIRFEADSGEVYELFHSQDCCESVLVEDICGELSDLVGSPILQAEKSTNSENPKTYPEFPNCTDESFLWTFYRLSTAKGQVVIRWYGSSNGYYSESVTFAKTN